MRLVERASLLPSAAAGMLALCASGSDAATPSLPVPCLVNSCGKSASAFVTYGTAGASISGTTLTVNQQSATAILNWASFNIAQGYKVNFLQPSATAQVLNNIWSANPSVISGALNANGQVYLYNQNGIVFANGAQVDVGSLTASTLNFSPVAGQSDPDYLFEHGLLSSPTSFSPGTLAPVFQAANGAAGTPYAGIVTVSPGATLTAADGGRIMLLGSAVTNAGTITTPDGQAILGAGSQVILAASSDPSLRGLLIEVNASGLPATVTDAITQQSLVPGTVNNAPQGTISAPRGNVTVAGLVVNQEGTVSATTSVSANGSIYLVAGDTSATGTTGHPAAFYNDADPGFGALLPNNGGTLTLAPGSVTEVLSDTTVNPTTTATISEENLLNNGFIPSQVYLAGQTVALLGDARIRAPGANVAIYAAANPATQFESLGEAYSDGGQIYLASGSEIDVSGLTNVQVSATRNIIDVTLEGIDLADDPLLRNGFLHGQTVTVNANQGSTLFPVSPYVDNIGIGIDEVLTAAGSIELDSDGSVIARAGSTMNVSGGSVAFQGGYAASTTNLLAANGKVYNISDAPTNIEYVALANSYSATDPTWGTKTELNPETYYPGYVQGNSAGQIEVLSSSGTYLTGTLLGTTVAGPNQRTIPTTLPTSPLSSYDDLPTAAALQIGCACENGTINDFRAPAVSFANGVTDSLGSSYDYLTDTLPAALQATMTLSPTALTEGGFTRISVFSNSAVDLVAGTQWNLGPAGSLSVTSTQSIAIDGNISGPDASVSLLTEAVSASDSSAHGITLAPEVILDVAGDWINDSPTLAGIAGPTATPPIATQGGSVTIKADGNLTLGAASVIDVSGGGWVNSANTLSPGSAGSISLAASYRAVSALAPPYTGILSIGPEATLVGDALSGAAGGKLSLTSGSVTIGTLPEGTPGELVIAPSFFTNQGFASYSITGQNDLIIGGPEQSGVVQIAPVVENLVFTRNDLLEPTGSNLAAFTKLEALPTPERSPVSLTFATSASLSAPGIADNGDILLGANASIVTDPQSKVTLEINGDSGSLSVLGSITAPAGTIDLSVAPVSTVSNPADSGNGYMVGQELLLGSQAVLDAAGVSEVDTLNAAGYREGSVLAGGVVSLQANKGWIVTDPGSVIDVHGVADTVDILTSGVPVPTLVAGNAGSILIDAREGIVLQGNLLGQAAPVAGAGGGSLTIGLDLFDYGGTLVANGVGGSSPLVLNPYPTTPRVLTLSDEAPNALYATQNGNPVLVSGQAEISTATIDAGGFDNVTLKSADVLAVSGSVSLTSKASLTLDAPVLEGNPGADATFKSAYVALGNYYNESDYFLNDNPVAATVLAPACAPGGACNATLNVDAQLIDIRGQSGLTGFATENLTSTGDIRLTTAENFYGLSAAPSFAGGLNVSGSLTLAAAQIYPTTFTSFELSASTAVTIAPTTASTLPAVPLSAGGSLTISAPSITQEGVLRAPMGQITLQGTETTNASGQVTSEGNVTLAPGSVTSVSTGGTVIPYGSTVNGQQWTYSPASGYTDIISLPPAKAITLSGGNVTIAGSSQNGGAATLNLSGGGDLFAYEWIAGTGGSTDILNPASGANQAGVKPYEYAIVPSLGSAFAPIDAQYDQEASGTKITLNQDIYLSGVPGLAAGYYALLPARYALLPGAFAVDIVKTNSDITAGSVVAQSNGSYLVAGQLAVAGTNILDSRTSTVLIAPSSVVDNQSQYTSSYANTFFSAAATENQTATPALPADAGILELLAITSLNLGGTINFAPGSFVAGTDAKGNPITQQGAGGVVSIQAPSIEVVDAASSSQTGVLQVTAQSLNSLGAQTVLIGATEQDTSLGEALTVGVTDSIEIANTKTALTAPQVILAAQDTITVDAAAKIIASGTLNEAPTALLPQGAGTLLDVSTAAVLPTVSASALAGQTSIPTGTLAIGEGAQIAATSTASGGATSPGGSILLFSTGNTTAAEGADISALSLGLYSGRVSLGDVPTGSSAPAGLNLTTELLGTLKNLQNLTIGSGSTIDFYGPVQLGGGGGGAAALQSITLNAQGLNGYDASTAADTVTLQAGNITLENTSGATGVPTYAAAGGGTGVLTVDAPAGSASEAGQIILGAGAKSIQGFGGGVVMNAAGDIVAQGTAASLTIGSGAGSAPVNLAMTGAALTAAAGSDQTITASGTVTLGQAPASAASAAAPALGGKLEIVGSGITQGTTIDLPAGIIELEATSGNVVLAKGSSTSAAGSDQNFDVTDAVLGGGQVSLIADQGNVIVSPGAIVDVAGATSANGKQSAGAGSLSVSAPAGQFTFAGSTLEGGAPAGQTPGNFTLDVGSGLAGNGFAQLSDALQGAGFTGALALRSRGDALVTVADTSANPAGIVASSFTLSTDQGAIVVAGTINTSGGAASSTDGGAISLWAQGNLTLEPGAQLLANAGTVGPVGANGTALTSLGGDVTLGTASGNLVLNGGKISLLGSAGVASDGTLTLRAPRLPDESDVQIQVAPGANVEVDTRKPVIVEGFQVYSASVLGSVDAGCNAGGSCDVNDTNGMIFTDAAGFAANGAAIAARLAPAFTNDLGSTNPVGIQVRPGVEVDSAEDLTVGDPNTTVWDLDTWNAALGVPVNVTLRAAGNLIFNASLSDGFNASEPFAYVTNESFVWYSNFGGSGAAGDAFAYGVTASYRLTAGADLSAANPLSVVPYSVAGGAAAQTSGDTAAPRNGNLILTPGNLIRTGDGNIDIAAGGDVLLGFNLANGAESYDSHGNLLVQESDPLTAAIYTAGVPYAFTPAQSTLFSAPLDPDGDASAAFPVDGGNLTVSAGNDILSAPSAQVVSDWLWRQAPVGVTPQTPLANADNTAWWVEFGSFEQGFGSFGGGNLTLAAGGNIVNASAVVPTTAFLLGANNTVPTLANLLVQGGGSLKVTAGGNIEGGLFQDDWGDAAVAAGGSITSGATLAQEVSGYDLNSIPAAELSEVVYPVILLGSGQFSLTARSDLTLNFVGNDTALPPSVANGDLTRVGDYFYTYSPSSSLNATSSGGSVLLLNEQSNLPIGVLNQQDDVAYLADNIGYPVYPPNANVVAPSGNIGIETGGTVGNGMLLFPSSTGNVTLLAGQSITGSATADPTSSFLLTMYETDPSQWPSALSSQVGTVIPNETALPTVPLHQDDPTPAMIVAKAGDISTSVITLPKAADLIAGGNIGDLVYSGKNLNPSDVTLIETGGSLDFSTPTAPITNALELNSAGITVAGPGYVDVLSGGSINLGDSNGILSTGNLNDARLPSGGATLVVGAGLGTNAGGGLRQPDYQAFITAYLAPTSSGAPSAYATNLIAYMAGLNPVTYANLGYPAALTAFEALTPAQQLPLISQVLSDELSATGLAHTLQGTSYARGYTAINTLFPTTDAKGNTLTYSGDLNMFYSQLKTEQGGDINLLVPGGSVVVGVPNPAAGLNTIKTEGGLSAAANLGVLVLGEGAVLGFADQNFEVNQSRILTLEGGDIILWASNGNIDAGKGAKSASSSPPPVIEFDAATNSFVVDPSNAVQGSGIGQLLSGPGETAGLVNLIAPKGDVNAGDAGIRVAGNLNIAAVQVIGAGNITVVGTATGVPVSEAGAFAGALSGANSLGDSSKNAVDQLSQNLTNEQNYQQLTDSLVPTFISVKMFCLGIECEQQ